jgi:predicted dienelactone hydrolase
MMKKLLLALLYLSTAVVHAQNYPIGKRTENFTDPSRSNRPVPTEIYYPAISAGTNTAIADGAFPLIVFAHGFLMSYTSYENISDFFVPKGYIVAFCNTENTPFPSHTNYGLDLKFIAERLVNALNESAGSFWQNKFSGKKAVMGHSMGGGASMIAASGNSIFDLVVGLAPAENGSAETSAASISAPLLIFAGSEDIITAPAAQNYPIYNAAVNSSCRTYINITGGGHCYFANTNLTCETVEATPTLTRAQQHAVVEDFSIAYFETFLKNNSSGWQAFIDSLAVSDRVVSEQNCDPNILSDGAHLTKDIAVFPNPTKDYLVSVRKLLILKSLIRNF